MAILLGTYISLCARSDFSKPKCFLEHPLRTVTMAPRRVLDRDIWHAPLPAHALNNRLIIFIVYYIVVVLYYFIPCRIGTTREPPRPVRVWKNKHKTRARTRRLTRISGAATIIIIAVNREKQPSRANEEYTRRARANAIGRDPSANDVWGEFGARTLYSRVSRREK